MNGTFEDFLDALLAFESGWDRERYDDGIIQDWQLDQWAGGSVETYYPQYSSWSQLTGEEWETMAYRSLNVFGFVGYQFGEALLIDLGYYDDDVYYLNGASTNTWDGTWTGKNGAESLEDFMTKEVQDLAIRDAFGHNLEIIEEGLAAAGTSLDDFLGTTRTYTLNGQQVSVELSLTGILAGAHLNGAPAMIELLLNDTVANDEFGTSTLQYIEQFGGYDSPEYDELIAYWVDNLTGDEGLGSNRGSANVDADTADVVVTWTYGQDEVVTDFDPGSDTIWVGWLTADDIEVYEENGSAVIAVPSNNQTTTLQGVSFAELSLANFTILDESAAQEILALVGSEDGSGSGTDDDNSDDGPTDDGSTDDGDGDGSEGDGSDGGDNGDGGDGGTTVPVSDHGTADVTKATATVVVTWAWGNNTVVSDFNPSTDTIFVDWFGKDDIEVSEAGGNVVFAMPGNNQTITLEGIALSDLSESNFTIKHKATAYEILSQLGQSGSDDGDGDGSDGQDSDPPDDDNSDDGPTDDGSTDDGDGDGSEGDGSDGGDNGDGGDGGTTVPVSDHGTADVTKATATVVVTWAWGNNTVVSDFNPSTDTIFVDWFGKDDIEVSEAGGNVVFAMPGNNQTITLEGIALSDLSESNFTIKHKATAYEILSQLGQSGSDDGDGDGSDGQDSDPPDDGTGDDDDGAGDDGTDDDGSADIPDDGVDVHQMTWNWGATEVISDFDISEDVLDFGSLPAAIVSVSEVDDDLVFEVLGNGGHTYVLENIQAEDLALANLEAPNWNSGVLDSVTQQLNLLGNDDIV